MIGIHLSKKEERTSIDRVMLAVSVINPLTALPQIIQIYTTKDVSGISVASWVLFAITSAIFLIYGILHKIKPIIITNLLWLVMDVAIIVGVMMYS